jgi:hypothetical protein
MGSRVEDELDHHQGSCGTISGISPVILSLNSDVELVTM